MKTRIPFPLTGQRTHIIIKRKLHNIALRKERDKQMPPKPKFIREEIVEKALELVAQGGEEALTARDLGQRLGSSARPIFTVFKNMEELQGEVRLAAMRRFEAYAGREMGETAEVCIQAICRDYGLSREKARVLFQNVWIYTFGVGTLCARGMCRFSQEEVGKMLSTTFRAMLLLAHADDSAEDAPSEPIP